MKAAFRSRLIAPIAAVIYALAILLPFLAVYSLPANTDGASDFSIFGDKILICTANGFELVSVEDLGKKQHAPNETFKCALCVVAAIGLATFAAQFATGIPNVLGMFRFARLEWPHTFALPSVPFSKALSRAPPLHMMLS